MQNGQPLTMAFRKEYRMLTDDERNRWHNALIEIKRNGEYDRMGFEHQTVNLKYSVRTYFRLIFLIILDFNIFESIVQWLAKCNKLSTNCWYFYGKYKQFEFSGGNR